MAALLGGNAPIAASFQRPGPAAIYQGIMSKIKAMREKIAGQLEDVAKGLELQSGHESDAVACRIAAMCVRACGDVKFSQAAKKAQPKD